MSTKVIKHSDFTGLAEEYSQYRPGYSESVLSAILALVDKPVAEMDCADVGAGTGIWTRMLAGRGCRSVVAIEPNDDMRRCGERDSRGTSIEWRKGNAENTGLPEESRDLLTMASAFHWVDFEVAMREFARVLRPHGRFVALWNPRLIEVNPLLMRIEEHLRTLKPCLERVSSGRSGITANLTERLWSSSLFDDVVYLEGRHVMSMTRDHYLGVWRSVNDLQAQLGTKKFKAFLDFVMTITEGVETIEAVYLTRAWSARRKE